MSLDEIANNNITETTETTETTPRPEAACLMDSYPRPSSMKDASARADIDGGLVCECSGRVAQQLKAEKAAKMTLTTCALVAPG